MHVFETPGGVSLQIKLPSGRVVIATVDEPRASVELMPIDHRGSDAVDHVSVSAHEHQGRHIIRIEQKDRISWGPIQVARGGDVEARITCPPGADLELSGGSTDLLVEGALGEVSVTTASGDARLEAVQGKLQVKTASGDISVAELESESSLMTVSGDLTVGRADGTLVARAVSGDVRIGSLRGSLTLSTTSGDVDVRSVEAGEVRIETVSGDVRVGVSRGTRVWIDAASVSGDLGSELGLDDREPDEDEHGVGPVVPLHVKTVSGDVSIVRSSEAVIG
jgi:Putative adhesin